jgi:hypothetical protein
MQTSKATLIYQTALGISVGDRVSTSYGTGGIVTHVSRPYYAEYDVSGLVVRTWPVVSLNYDGDKIINDIRIEGDRWFTDADDEIFVEKAHNKPEYPLQMDMFETALEPFESYRFRAGVDYSRNVWMCEECGDVNASPEMDDMRWHCPICGKYGVTKIILMQPRVHGKKQLNSYLLSLGYMESR